MSVSGQTSAIDPLYAQLMSSYEVFARLHRRGQPLLLANAWDVASAAVTASAGAPAIATTSGGMSWAHGVPDGGLLGALTLSAAVARIVAAVDVPVTVDIEEGYGSGPGDVADTVRAVLDAGAVGINLEDRPAGETVLFSPHEQAARISAARRAAEQAKQGLWINARTDTYLAEIGEPGQRLALTLKLAQVYADAGADSIFVPRVTAPDTVTQLVNGPLPVNLLVGAGAPAVSDLAGLGVARISLGSAIAQAAYALAERAAREMFTVGTYDATSGGVPNSTMNAYMTRPETAGLADV